MICAGRGPASGPCGRPNATAVGRGWPRPRPKTHCWQATRQVQAASSAHQRLDLATAARAEAYNQLSPGAAEAKGDLPQRAASISPLPWRLAASAAGFSLAGFARIRGADWVNWPCGQNPGRKPEAANALRRARR